MNAKLKLAYGETEKWHFYLYGHLYFVTNHLALKTLLAPGKCHKLLLEHCWVDLMQYVFDVQYESGQETTMADCLSRMASGLLDFEDMNQANTTMVFLFGPISYANISDSIKYTQDDMQLQNIIYHDHDG